jgi:hypothetical protein
MIRTILAFLAVIAFVVAQQEHCLDKAFESHILLINPTRRYEDFHHVWFDSTTNKQRTDFHEVEPHHRTISIYLRHDLGKQFNYNNHTKECTIHPLSGKLEPFCLAKNATKGPQYTLGGQTGVKVDLWEEQFHEFNLRVGLTPQGVPVNLLARGGTHHHERHVFEEWVNFQHGVKDQSVFEPPKECSQQSNTRNVAPREEMSMEFYNAMQRMSPLLRQK